MGQYHVFTLGWVITCPERLPTIYMIMNIEGLPCRSNSLPDLCYRNWFLVSHAYWDPGKPQNIPSPQRSPCVGVSLLLS